VTQGASWDQADVARGGDVTALDVLPSLEVF
jgi:hypothetical protein